MSLLSLFAQGSDSMSTTHIVMIVLLFLALIIFLVLIAVFARYARLWIQSFTTGAGIGILDLLGMTFRKVNPNVIVRGKIMLVQAGADLESKTHNDLTPLMHAVVSCKPRLVAALITAGAKLDARNALDRTALQEAGGCPTAAQQLRAAGAR